MFMMISFVVGVFVLQWFRVLPSLSVVFCITVALFLLVFFSKKILRVILLIFCCVSLGFLWADYLATRQQEKQLPDADFGKSVSVRGWVASIPKETPLSMQFLLRLQCLDGHRHGGLVRVSWYQRHQKLAVGTYLHVQLKLKKIHGLRNPDGFDYQRWAFSRGIVASGYVIAMTAKPKVIARNVSDAAISYGQGDCFSSLAMTGSFRDCFTSFAVTAYRANLQSRIQANIHDKNLASIINALSIGSKALIHPDTWQVFQRTGTSHLVAISGLHVGLVVAVIYFLVAWLWRRFPFLLLRIPAQRVAAVLALLSSWCYGLLVGFSLPTERAVIMFSVLMLSQFFIRQVSLWYRLLLAFFAVIVFQPLALFSASFWLSFMAVFWMAYAMLVRPKNKKKIEIWFRIQYALFLGLLPAGLFYFHQFALVSFVANAVAIPWVTILLVPMCLLASLLNLISPILSGYLFFLSAKLLMPLWWFFSFLSQFQYAVWVHPIHSFFVLISTLMAVLLLLAPKGFPCRYLSIIFMLPFILFHEQRPKPGGVYLSLLDVGQGLSAVIRTANHLLIYDAGPKYPSGFDAGRSVVMPYLQDIGVRKIDMLMVSHGDNDHIGGVHWLLSHLPVKRVVTSVPQSHWQQFVDACYAGKAWIWDGVQFQVLSPAKNETYADNNSSCVLRVTAGGRHILLTGDIEKPAERYLLSHRKKALPASIIIAPHHGSRSSSSWAFVQVVHPEAVLIPVGFQNRYRFPAASVLARYHRVGAKIFPTSHLGAIQVKISPAGRVCIRPTYQQRHYWQK